MAQACGLNYDSKAQAPIVDQICLELVQAGMADLAWNEDDLVQRTYKAQGLKRYKIDMQALTQKKSTVESHMEEFVSSGSLSSGSNMLNTLQGAVEIKVESQAVLDLMSTKAIVKTGESKVQALGAETKRLQYNIEVLKMKGQDEGEYLLCVLFVVFGQ